MRGLKVEERVEKRNGLIGYSMIFAFYPVMTMRVQIRDTVAVAEWTLLTEI